MVEDTVTLAGQQEQPHNKMSGDAVTGFILSLLGIPYPTTEPIIPQDFMWILFGTHFVLTLSFCWAGLRQIGNGKRQKGRGLAKAGIIIALFSAVLASAFALAGY